MPVEPAVYLDTLNDSYPGGGESKTQGDDHLRLLKGVLKRTFPALTGVVTLSQTVLNALPTRLGTLEAQFLVSTLVKLASDLDANAHSLVNLRTPVADAEAAPKVYVDTTVTTAVAAAVSAMHPVNSLFLSVSSVNPGDTVVHGGLGFGTWTQVGQGTFLAAVGTGTDVNSVSKVVAAGANTGSYQHALTQADLPAGLVTDVSFANGTGASSTVFGNQQHILETATTASPVPVPTAPPAFGVYVWKRTA